MDEPKVWVRLSFTTSSGLMHFATKGFKRFTAASASSFFGSPRNTGSSFSRAAIAASRFASVSLMDCSTPRPAFSMNSLIKASSAFARVRSLRAFTLSAFGIAFSAKVIYPARVKVFGTSRAIASSAISLMVCTASISWLLSPDFAAFLRREERESAADFISCARSRTTK